MCRFPAYEIATVCATGLRVLDQVDMNQVLDRIDLDRLLERIDLNDLVEHIDVEALVKQTDLGAVIAASSSGIAGDVLDVFRARPLGSMSSSPAG